MGTVNKQSILKININQLQWSIIKQLEKYPTLLESLDRWILFPNYDFIDDLYQLSVIVNKLYKQNPYFYVYRGINMGFKISHKLGLKDPVIGQRYHYDNKDEALSFTSDKRIARSFGEVIIVSKLSSLKDKYLNITDELAYIISRMRNIKPETQKEVIILPGTNLDFEVIEINKTNKWIYW